MKPHLKAHTAIWRSYVDLKFNFQTKDIPINKEELHETAKQAIEKREENKTSLGPIWDNFEKDLTDVSIEDTNTILLHEITD